MEILIALLPIILELIKDCQDDNELVMIRRIRNPGPFATIRLARAVKDERGLTGRGWRRQRRAIIQEIRDKATALTDDECRELIAQYKADIEE